MASASAQVFLLSLTCVLFSSCNSQGSSDIRLVGGSNQYEGRVEVNRSGEWQTVCDDFWDIREAEVVCRQLGYGYAILAIQGAAFGEGSGGQWETEWSCSGNEFSLNDCSSSSAFCSHSEDASVICSGNNALSNGALRLVDTGRTRFGGRLEVYYNSEWGTVCDDGWGFSDATVACRQMGFVGVCDSDSSLFGSGASSQRIWLDDVACHGSESRLIDCSHDGIGNTADCSHIEDVRIVCNIGLSPDVNEGAGTIALGPVVGLGVSVGVFICLLCICFCLGCGCLKKKKRQRHPPATHVTQLQKISMPLTIDQSTVQHDQYSSYPPQQPYSSYPPQQPYSSYPPQQPYPSYPPDQPYPAATAPDLPLGQSTLPPPYCP